MTPLKLSNAYGRLANFYGPVPAPIPVLLPGQHQADYERVVPPSGTGVHSQITLNSDGSSDESVVVCSGAHCVPTIPPKGRVQVTGALSGSRIANGSEMGFLLDVPEGESIAAALAEATSQAGGVPAGGITFHVFRLKDSLTPELSNKVLALPVDTPPSPDSP